MLQQRITNLFILQFEDEIEYFTLDRFVETRINLGLITEREFCQFKIKSIHFLIAL